MALPTTDTKETSESPDTNTGELSAKVQGNTLRYVQELHDTARKQRYQFERQWYLNMAFYAGRQWVAWQGLATSVANEFGRLVEPKAPSWRVRLIANKIRPVIRKELAKITKEKPQTFVVPASSDDEDIAAAHAGEKINEHLWRELEMNKVLRRTVFWACLCGSSFIKDWFGEDIEVEPVSPFHFLIPDVQEEELENQPFVIHTLAKSPDWVWQKFKVNVEADTKANTAMMEQRFLSALGINQNDKQKSHVTVNEIWLRPNRKFENGAKVIWTKDKILSIKENGWPYEHGEYPFTKIDHIPTGHFYGASVIEDLVPLQKEYNRTRSQIIEAKNRMSKPQLMAPRGSVNPRQITSEPGLVILYTPGFQAPEPLPLQNIPGYVIQELDRIQMDINDISGQHEVTKGQTPPGVTAATAISFLQEEDDSLLSPTIANVEEAVERLGRHFLSHVHQFWADEHKIKVVGENGQWEVLEFNKSSIKDNTDLRVEAGSATPRSRAAKQAFIMELAQNGIIPPDRVLRYLGMAETGRMYEEFQVDTRQAQRENVRMSEGDIEEIDLGDGQPIRMLPPNSWDDHLVHIHEHNTFRKKQAFEALDDEAKQQFEQHVQLHTQVIQQQMMQAQANGQQPGQPGQPGQEQGGGQNAVAPTGSPQI